MALSGMPLLLLIDDEPAQKRFVSALAARAGWRTIYASDQSAALATLGTRDGMQLDAVLIDHWNPGMKPVETIREIRARRPSLPILVITSQNDVLDAVEAMRAGATDYLAKPIAPDRFLAALNATLDRTEEKTGELRPLSEKLTAPLAFNEIVGGSPNFLAALAIAAKAARARVPVLIEGESGVGKEVIAQAIHAASPRHRNRMVAVNCGAIPANLVESELFGHERGAFTGAFERQIGKFTDADMGTIFLDEISEMPLEAQVKLLRVLQEGEVQPLGARLPLHIDVRVIAATNKVLEQEVAAGRFREDLYYRLNVMHVTVPPLRERTNDIPALARHLLARLSSQHGLPSLSITNEALSLLMQHDWPGNVRQLHNVLFRAAVLCDGDFLTPQDFPHIAAQARIHRSSQSAAQDGADHAEGGAITLYEQTGHIRQLADIEADVIRLAIGHYRGRMTEVARRLGIGRSTLYRKLTELGIDNVA
ncbi:MAG: sigma-54-dependent Fis family transcriptional regulator [Sphingobium sp.]|nr:sigma-54-dependent Fis family transcriptional regulator [Sphingobium sp.]MBP6112841.1 sigma-54-dependent Fis family transcriptional regulator [Sphingobium sp.]MBP8670790.1 sigma-54-dependent Fis family transcriptional regulator [Sphingobium sp.]MBP9157736.1 sigma-54-dependent Fis family transcriptional regulator [Sphingobium sp.]MCC6481033.1 sigma-54-dependent Fis family transcriptional regulator [Sphingomonadaceae bacterium]